HHYVYRAPDKEGDKSNQASTQQIVLTKRNRGCAMESDHGKLSSSFFGKRCVGSDSRATAIKSSSSVSLPCVRKRFLGSPSNRMRPLASSRTRSQTSSTSYMLCEVQRIPP